MNQPLTEKEKELFEKQVRNAKRFIKAIRSCCGSFTINIQIKPKSK